MPIDMFPDNESFKADVIKRNVVFEQQLSKNVLLFVSLSFMILYIFSLGLKRAADYLQAGLPAAPVSRLSHS